MRKSPFARSDVLFEQFDTIRIINLAYRKDRRSEMIGQLKDVGLVGDERVAFFDAISFADAGTFSSRGARGVFHSHLAILEAAAAASQSVLILEDDVDFLPQAVGYVTSSDWQIFYGGYYPSDPEDLQGSDIIGAHFMGFSAEIVPELVSYLRQILECGDHPPIDGAYVWFRRAYPNVRTEFAQPPLGVQRPSRTDIANLRFYDRLPVFRGASSIARRVKRHLHGPTGLSFGIRGATILAIGAIGGAALIVWSFK